MVSLLRFGSVTNAHTAEISGVTNAHTAEIPGVTNAHTAEIGECDQCSHSWNSGL